MTLRALHGATFAVFVLAASPAISQTEIGKLRDSNPKISGAVTEM